jgi:hypothetical protein
MRSALVNANERKCPGKFADRTLGRYCGLGFGGFSHCRGILCTAGIRITNFSVSKDTASLDSVLDIADVGIYVAKLLAASHVPEVLGNALSLFDSGFGIVFTGPVWARPEVPIAQHHWRK